MKIAYFLSNPFKNMKKKSTLEEKWCPLYLKIYLSIISDKNWLRYLICRFYTLFKHRYTSGTKCRYLQTVTAFLSFMEFYVINTPKKSRGKNLIMVTTLKFWVLVLNYKFPNLYVFLWLCDLFELVRSSKMFLGHRIGSRIWILKHERKGLFANLSFNYCSCRNLLVQISQKTSSH